MNIEACPRGCAYSRARSNPPVIDPKRETVTVASREGSTKLYEKRDSIPPTAF
jgi:hypothetical protein